MSKSARSVWLTIAALLTLTPGALAFEVRESALVGGPGGANSTDQCKPDYDFLAGIRYSAGKDLNEVRGMCRPYIGNGQFGDIYDLKNTWGHPPAADASPPGIGDAIVCPTGQVVYGIEVQNSHAPLVHSYRLSCKTPFTDTGMTVTKWARIPGGEGTTSTYVDCGGSPAIGIAARHGGNIDAMGLLCGVSTAQPPAPKTAPAPTPPPPAAKPPAPVKPPITVGNGGGDDDNGNNGNNGNGFARKRAAGGNGGGGGGGNGSAASDTTIYDEPEGNDAAYLQSGDPVTIVGCNENNWCQISRPVRGWVWGDDLNH